MKLVRVKICGITSMDDAVCAVECGADAVGFVFWEKSARYIAPDAAGDIARRLGPFVTIVGVFVDASMEMVREYAREACCGVVQLHGDETPEACREIREATGAGIIKAFRIRDRDDTAAMERYDVGAYLLDAFSEHGPGGTGRRFDWNIAVEAGKNGRIILSGGLTPSNVADAVRRVAPYGVDVSSGVETEPGRKDHAKVAAFIRAARGT